MNVRISIDVELAADADPDKVAEALFDFLIDPPDDLFPEIKVVLDWQARVEQ